MREAFDRVWNRISDLQGSEFRTVTGLRFTYIVSGNGLHPSRAKQRIGRSDFEKAAPMMDSIRGPGDIANRVRGSAYVFAILSDPRVVGRGR